jgi:FkbM family methyltransferase
MQSSSDPQLGSSPARNGEFEKTHTRGRVISEHVGHEQASTIIDVGAYRGETAEWFSILFPNVTIWAVEPFPKSFAEWALKSSTRIRTLNFPVTNLDGQVELHYNSIPDTNGIYRINSESSNSLSVAQLNECGTFGANSIVGSMMIDARSLNSFVVGQNI